MFKVVVCIIILVAVCCAREHLTCLRTDDVLNQQNPQSPQREMQGPPGKRGAKGQVGSRGKRGQKGEPGIPDNYQIKLLRDQLNSVVQEVEALNNQQQEQIYSLSQEVKELKNQRKEIHKLSDHMWYLPPNAYDYKVTPDYQSWQESEEYCQDWGGNLAVHGVKTINNRKKLIQNLLINIYDFWIGANDIASEGNWTWVNGEPANNSELIWFGGNRRKDRNANCIVVAGNYTYPNEERAYDYSCTHQFRALCEKML